MTKNTASGVSIFWCKIEILYLLRNDSFDRRGSEAPIDVCKVKVLQLFVEPADVAVFIWQKEHHHNLKALLFRQLALLFCVKNRFADRHLNGARHQL